MVAAPTAAVARAVTLAAFLGAAGTVVAESEVAVAKAASTADVPVVAGAMAASMVAAQMVVGQLARGMAAMAVANRVADARVGVRSEEVVRESGAEAWAATMATVAVAKTAAAQMAAPVERVKDCPVEVWEMVAD